MSALKNSKHCHPHAKVCEGFLQDETAWSKKVEQPVSCPALRIAWRVLKSPDAGASPHSWLIAIGLG